MQGRVLVVDDDRAMLDLLEEALSRKGLQIACCQTAREAMLALQDSDYDAVVTDVRMFGADGIELCERIVANRPEVQVVVITAFGSLETAVAALRAGAFDFITKPLDIDILALTLERAIQQKLLRQEVRRLRQTIERGPGPDEIIGESQPMRNLATLIDRVAESNASVLISGETGTGKELVARAIHRRSQQSGGSFVAIDCAAMPENLLESELFGHVKGAFTDAKNPRTGLLVQADRGTLFLDEIGNLPAGLQPKLLRALQERTVRPVGGSEEVQFDTRIIAATNRDIESDVESGGFRKDLYYRINVISVEVPPLRARGNDVLLLAQHFVKSFAERAGKDVRGISTPTAERILNYAWPGNIRELQNCMERAVALTRFDQIAVEDLPEKIQKFRRSHFVLPCEETSELLPLQEVERRYILKVLEEVNGNKTLAARILGLDRKTLYRKLGRFGDSSQ